MFGGVVATGQEGSRCDIFYLFLIFYLIRVAASVTSTARRRRSGRRRETNMSPRSRSQSTKTPTNASTVSFFFDFILRPGYSSLVCGEYAGSQPAAGGDSNNLTALFVLIYARGLAVNPGILLALLLPAGEVSEVWRSSTLEVVRLRQLDALPYLPEHLLVRACVPGWYRTGRDQSGVPFDVEVDRPRQT